MPPQEHAVGEVPGLGGHPRIGIACWGLEEYGDDATRLVIRGFTLPS